jgi:multiple sugar transport system permease protein
MALPTGVITALCLALLLNRNIVGRPILRAIIFVPSLIPLVAMAVLIRGMFNGDYGVVNLAWEWLGGHVDSALGLLGLGAPEWMLHGPNWLGDPKWMKPTLVLMSLYGVGGAVVIYLAGLQEVPRQLYEAADIDGASAWQKTWHITIPMISPVIYFNLIITSIFVLQIFVQSYVVYDYAGGADRAALFYTMHLINQGFVYLRMGYACAMAWILFTLVAALTYLAHRLTESRVHYGGA